jgi:hypothetical protein
MRAAAADERQSTLKRTRRAHVVRSHSRPRDPPFLGLIGAASRGYTPGTAAALPPVARARQNRPAEPASCRKDVIEAQPPAGRNTEQVVRRIEEIS